MNRAGAVRPVVAVLCAGVLGLGVASCSSHDSSSVATATAASATEIAFAQGMIPHHEQAVEMADLALDPKSEASPQVKELARQIKDAQDPEITQMQDWLQEWGAPSSMPSATGDMAHMDHGGHDMGGMTMSGMMSAADMQELAQSRGKAFDTMWMQMMIAHHEGAVSMAEQVDASSTDPEVTALADSIIKAQKREIDEMRAMLAQS